MSAPSATPRAAAVAMRGIQKRFGAVQANRDVALTVAAGTVHGIVGENGAGKSTLMSILYGFYQADAGSLEIEGKPVQIRDSRHAIAHGIGMVHQHFMLVDDLSALDNVMLGAEGHWRLAPARAAVRAKLEALMQRTGLHVRLEVAAEDLPVGERQRLEILKALVRGARILILDEPTAVLTPQETEQLFATLRTLREQGTTILIITHKLKEILALCDHVTVMRQGAVVLDAPIGQVTLDSLAQAMVGRGVKMGRVADGTQVSTKPEGKALLAAQALSWRDEWGVARLSDVSLQLHAGEIVGVAGVSGNGQSELLDVLSGLLAPEAGSLQLGGERFEVSSHHKAAARRKAWLSPERARELGLAHVPEDRHKRGLVLAFEAWESAVLGYQRLSAYSSGTGLMKSGAMHEATQTMMNGWDVRPPNPALRSSKFSGGNQQKLVLAREAAQAPKVLLVGQPTRGVDIGAIEFIHARLRALRDAGSAVLVVSSELDEILALSDRVVVMNAGRVSGELPIAQCTEQALGRLMAGAELGGDGSALGPTSGPSSATAGAPAATP